MWYCVLTFRPVDPLALATGGVSVGLLVYGAAVVHRAMLVNLFPLGFSFYDGVWGLSGAAAAALQIAGSCVLFVSSLVILWTVYHSNRDRWSLEKGLPIAFLLALPMVTYELARHFLGIDVYDAILGTLLGALH